MDAKDATTTARLTPTAVWRTTPTLIVTLDGSFGEPVDAYVNGSQVWLRDDGPAGMAIEWRLHPVAGYVRPKRCGTYDVFSLTALALAQHDTPPAPLTALWDGLEAFPAHDDEIEPAVLASHVTAALGIAPDAFGLVDHARIGLRWEHSGRKTSIVADLLAELGELAEPGDGGRQA